MDGPKPKYQWRQTWADEANHFTGYDGDRKIAHMHAHHMAGWMWFMIFELPWRNKAVIQLLTGHADTARQAACEAKACYEAVLAGAWPGMAPEDIETAARLKAGGPYTGWSLTARDHQIDANG